MDARSSSAIPPRRVPPVASNVDGLPVAAAPSVPVRVGLEFVGRVLSVQDGGLLELGTPFGAWTARTDRAPASLGAVVRYRVTAVGPPIQVRVVDPVEAAPAGAKPAVGADVASIAAAVADFGRAVERLTAADRRVIDPGDVVGRFAALSLAAVAGSPQPAVLAALVRGLGHDLQRRGNPVTVELAEPGPPFGNTVKDVAVRVLAAGGELAERLEPVRAEASLLVQRLGEFDRDDARRAERTGFEAVPLVLGWGAACTSMRCLFRRPGGGSAGAGGDDPDSARLVIALDLAAFGPLRVDVDWRAIRGVPRVGLAWTVVRPGVADWIVDQRDRLADCLRTVGVELRDSTVSLAAADASVALLCVDLEPGDRAVDVHV